MTELLPLSIGIGLVVSLLFTELFGIAAGGMVVPGYIALSLGRPLDVVLTLVAAFATFAIVRALSTVLIVYGRRRTVMMILIGFMLGGLMRYVLVGYPGFGDDGLTVIGYIIPGLIAIWLDRQGVVETMSSLIIASVVVRLILILIAGAELHI